MRWLAFLSVLLLCACHTVSDKKSERPTAPFVNKYQQHNDSAPSKPTRFSTDNAKPTHEPLSRYGNPQSYHVLGKSYEVLRSANGYKAKGIASWYGTKFHKYRTSSGETYDMYAMTAAHKTLPLPCYVKVTNLSNGKQAIVRVNDRGPFHAGRIIDLSYAAANKLGLMPKGTAPVQVETIPTAQSTPAQYFVQAGAFDTQKGAEKLFKQIVASMESPAKIEHYESRYIVTLGPFAEKAATDTVKRRLATAGVKGAFTVLR